MICKTCAPGAAKTEAVKDVGSMTADPLSIEYPIETAGMPAQVVVLALTWKGDVSWAPFEGAETVIALIGAVHPTRASAATINFFIESNPCMRRQVLLEGTGRNDSGGTLSE
jgi:hypothetical protein